MQERRILESWKEISSHLHKSVRTCRRWENDYGLPIHRIDGSASGRVFAFPEELDQWVEEKLHHAQKGKSASRAWGRHKKAIIGGTGAVVGLAALAFIASRMISGRPGPLPEDSPIVAVLPFENLTGDEVLESWRTAFPDLLITDLRQSRYINVVPIISVVSSLKTLKLEGAKPFSPADLAAIAGRLETDFAVTGSLIRSGEDIIVNTFVKETTTGADVKALRVNVRGEQGLLEEADGLSKKIKQALNLTPRQMSADIDRSVRRIATGSPEAFKLYSRASRLRPHESFPDMVADLRKAIDRDPEFGLAHRLLCSAYGDMHIEDMVRSYLRVMELSGRLSEREWLPFQADFILRYGVMTSKLAEADIPAATMKKLGPMTTADALRILERLASLYPGPASDYVPTAQLWNAYMLTEEWDKAISLLEGFMTTPLRTRWGAQTLVLCHHFKGRSDTAEEILERLTGADPKLNLDDLRVVLARDRGDFDQALGYIEKRYAPAVRKAVPYDYYSEVGYLSWFNDDLDNAEKAYRTVVDPNDPGEQSQRSINLAALCLSRGQVGQAMDLARELLEHAKKVDEPTLKGRERNIHYGLACYLQLAGRPEEALNEAEEACRDVIEPGMPADMAAKILHLRALLALEMNRLEEFESGLEEIRQLSVCEVYPKLMRAYYHLLGRRALGQNRAQEAINLFTKALDLSTPSTRNSDRALCLYSLAKAHELNGNRLGARLCYEQIVSLKERESFCGDLHARAFYGMAKFWDYNWSKSSWTPREEDRTKAVEYYRKFLSLWGNADPIFLEVADARARLAALESS